MLHVLSRALLHTASIPPYHSWEGSGGEQQPVDSMFCAETERYVVTQEELDEIHAFLNDRPRECIGFRSPREYYENLTASVLLRGSWRRKEPN